MTNKALELEKLIDTFNNQAREEVAYAKGLNMQDEINPHTYLYGCIKAFAEMREAEEIGIIANLDVRYRAFVLEILKEAKEQNLVDYMSFFKGVLIGR